MDRMVAIIEYPLVAGIVRTLAEYDADQEPTIVSVDSMPSGRVVTILRFRSTVDQVLAGLALGHAGYIVRRLNDRTIKVYRGMYQEDTRCTCGSYTACLERAPAE